MRRILCRTICFLSIAVSAAAEAKDGLTAYGDVAQYALPAGAALISLWRGDSEGLAQFAESGAATLAATYALKYVVNERRPDGGSYSFPSGHSALAFTGAAYVHERYGWQWGLPAELAAGLVAYSRVDAKRHYWHDVIASAALAHLSAYLLVDHRDAGVTLLPMVGGRKPAFGIMGAVRF